jgi:hypothetical protein
VLTYRSQPQECALAGSDGGAESWATCKLNDVDLYAYLADTLTRIVN